MVYSSDFARLLIDQLARIAGENRHQLVGHMANLDFWLSEVRHCLGVIDGYSARFANLKAAQTKYVSEHVTTAAEFDDPVVYYDRVAHHSVLPRPAWSDVDRKETRRALCDAVYRFLRRCYRDKLLDESSFRKACDSLGMGVDPADIRTTEQSDH